METLNLPIEVETLLTNIFANSYCSCHFINPQKTRIILWKEVKNGQEIYHLRIGLQRFLSLDCLDRNGDTYWKFEIPEVKKTKEIQTELDPITKFRQRPEKVKDYAKPDSTEQSVNNEQSN
mgnify:CR=1 FL=1